MELLTRFEEALSKGYIKAYFQPLTRTLSGKVCGAEALARWVDPEKGTIPPMDFIPFLEEHRLIHKLDLKMLENVCKFYRDNNLTDMNFSINLSRIDFAETDMFTEISSILKKYDVPINAINLEITESTMLENTEKTRNLFDEFHNAGYKAWIDDFGSGYSSLTILRDYDFDVLKMDMALLKKFDSRSRKIISSVVNMTKTLGIHVLAEGVETKEQTDFLRDIGCEIMQGYYFAKPMCETDFLEYLKTHQAETRSEFEYWHSAGLVNILSADPLIGSPALSEGESTKEIYSTAPFSFIEYCNGMITYPYMNEAYIRQIKKIGFSSSAALESNVNDKEFEHYGQFTKQIEKVIKTGKVQKRDNIIGDVVYTLNVRPVASSGDRHLIASTAYVINSEKSDFLVIQHSQSLYATYDLVTEITPDKDQAIQIYSNAGFVKVYGTVSLRNGISEFAASEIHPDDKERYLQFFDLDTLKERAAKYIQEQFRVNSKDGYETKNFRISNVGKGKYLFTIQSV